MPRNHYHTEREACACGFSYVSLNDAFTFWDLAYWYAIEFFPITRKFFETQFVHHVALHILVNDARVCVLGAVILVCNRILLDNETQFVYHAECRNDL